MYRQTSEIKNNFTKIHLAKIIVGLLKAQDQYTVLYPLHRNV